MVKSCGLKNCKKEWKPCSEIGFHRFPIMNQELLAKWIDNIPKHLLPNRTKNAFICSKHFERSCYEVGSIVRKTLKKDAVPTIFEDLDENESDTNTSINETNLSSSQQPVNSNQPIIESINGTTHIDYKNIPDLRTVRKIDVGVQVENRYLPASPVKAKLKKEIRILQQRIKRRDEALTSLKVLLVQLKMYKGIK